MSSSIILIVSLLLLAVPIACGMWIVVAIAGTIVGIIRHIGFTVKTWFKPHIQYVYWTDGELKRRYREMDIKENGYNPMRHDFHVKELFPRKPELEKIKVAAKGLFPNRYDHLLPKGDLDDYHFAESFYLNMAVERHYQLTANQWSEYKEKQWLAMPYLPKVMLEIDDEFVKWCFLAVGHDLRQHMAS